MVLISSRRPCGKASGYRSPSLGEVQSSQAMHSGV